MGSKNEPGAFDCYEKAEPDEPIFVLLGRDPLAAALVQAWAILRDDWAELPRSIETARKIEEAQDCAVAMARYCEGRDDKAPPIGIAEATSLLVAAAMQELSAYQLEALQRAEHMAREARAAVAASREEPLAPEEQALVDEDAAEAATRAAKDGEG